MANYPPPVTDLPVYSSTSFYQDDEGLTFQDAEKYFLRYPQAQGTQNLLNTNIAGVTKLMNNVILDDLKSAPVLSTDENGKIISGSTVATHWEQIGNDIYNTNPGEVFINDDLNISTNLLVGGNSTVIGDMNVNGNFNVNGTETIINTETINLEDNLIRINYGQTGIPPSSLKSGIEVERGDEENYLFVFDEATDLFKVGEGVAGLQAVATRDDSMTSNIVPYWNDTAKKFTSSNIDSTTLGYLNGVSSNVQTQLNNKVSVNSNITIDNENPVIFMRNGSFEGGEVRFGTSSHGIKRNVNQMVYSSAHANGDHIFNNTNQAGELMRLKPNGNVGINTSNPQTRLHVNGTIRSESLDTGRVLISDSNKNIVSSNVSNTTLGYLDATSSIQTQLNNKVGTTGHETIDGNKTFNGLIVANSELRFTDSTTRIMRDGDDKLAIRCASGKRLGIYTGSPNIERFTFADSGNFGINTTDPQTRLHVNGSLRCEALTTNRVVVADSNKNMIGSNITTTELEALSGVSGNIQDQLNDKNNLYTFTSRDNDPGPEGICIGEVDEASGGIAKLNYNNTTSISAARHLDVEIQTDSITNKNAVLNIFKNSKGSGNKTIYIYGRHPTDPTRTQLVHSLRADNTSYFTRTDIGIDTIYPEERLHVNGNIRSDNLTGDRVLISASNKNIASSNITTTQLGYLDGATGNIQNQIDTKVPEVKMSASLNTPPPVITTPKIYTGRDTTDNSGDITISWADKGITWSSIPNVWVQAIAEGSNYPAVNSVNTSNLNISSYAPTTGTKTGFVTFSWLAIGH